MTLLEIPTGDVSARASIPVLETERLVLRAPRLGDAKTVAALANDRRIAENTARIPHPYRIADAEDFIATRQPAGGEARVRRSRCATARIIGACGFTQVGPPARRRSATGSASSYWGKGYATEAVRAVIDHAFTDLDYEALQAARASPIRRRAACWRSAASSGPASASSHPRDLNSSAPIDRFRLDRGLWASLKSWGASKRRCGLKHMPRRHIGDEAIRVRA